MPAAVERARRWHTYERQQRARLAVRCSAAQRQKKGSATPKNSIITGSGNQMYHVSVVNITGSV